jgi:hypothetical protein
MSVLIDPETGELVRVMDEAEARELTNRIRDAADALWSLLAEAHQRQAWRALGYSRWEDYVRAEFNMARSTSYQILDQAGVIRAIEAAIVSADADTPPPAIVVTEAQARDLKPVLEDVTTTIRERVAAEPVLSPVEIQEIVEQTITEHRAKVQQQREDAAAMAEMRRLATAAGLDQNEDRIAQRGAFARLCRDLVALGDPGSFVDRHFQWLDDDDHDLARRASKWLTAYLEEIQ